MSNSPLGEALAREERERLAAERIDVAREYVGTTPTSGVAQFGALALAGVLHRDVRVLEYGCGTLHLARVLLPYLDGGRYCAVEPNRWLVDAALDADPELRRLFAEREVHVASRDDFSPDDFATTGTFDVVFAHSVLSHAAHWQLWAFLGEANVALRHGGAVLASYRRGEDSDCAEWQYPGVSWFSLETLQGAATDTGFGVVFPRPDVQRFYMAACPDEVHDWFEVHKLGPPGFQLREA